MGAFEQLFGPVRGELEQKFSKNSNARGVARVGGGMLKLRFHWYILLLVFSVTSFKIDQNKNSKLFDRLSPESGNRKKVDVSTIRNFRTITNSKRKCSD